MFGIAHQEISLALDWREDEEGVDARRRASTRTRRAQAEKLEKVWIRVVISKEGLEDQRDKKRVISRMAKSQQIQFPEKHSSNIATKASREPASRFVITLNEGRREARWEAMG